MNNSTKSYLALSLQSVIIGFSFFFVKKALLSTDTYNLLAHRFSITAVCILFYLLLTRKNIDLSVKDWKKIVPYSLGFPILFFLFQTIGLKYISSSESGIIYATTPILTFIIAKIFLKEENTRLQTIFMITSVFRSCIYKCNEGF